MPFLILSVVLQVALVVHIVKTNRNTTWIWIVVMLPMAGSIAYLLLEVLPELTSSRAARSTRRNVEKLVNPDRDLKAAVVDLATSDSIENSMRLASECESKKMFAEARDLYKKCLKGQYLHDPEILLGLANAEFELKNYSVSKKQLDLLKQYNPDFSNAKAHLLYARTVESEGDIDAALHEYAALYGYAPDPEVSVRYADLLVKANRNREANDIYAMVIASAQKAGKHHQRLHSDWIRRAQTARR